MAREWNWLYATNPVSIWKNFQSNFGNGYQFGDVIGSLFGVRDNEDALDYYSKEDPFSVVGDALNGITGVTATNNMNSALAAENRQFQTSEREAAQEFNSAEAVKDWERSEESAQRARDFTAMMDNTALQRRMADAEAAGVNPMMLFGGSGLSAGFQGSTAGSSSAATVNGSSGSQATASGNSAAAVGGIILALTQLLKVAKGKPVTSFVYGGE